MTDSATKIWLTAATITVAAIVLGVIYCVALFYISIIHLVFAINEPALTAAVITALAAIILVIGLGVAHSLKGRVKR